MFVSILTCNDRQDRAQLRNEFLAFDTENTGTITQIQVGSCLKCLSFEYWFGFIYPYVFWKDQVYTVFPFVWDSWKIETVWTHCLSFVHVFQCCQRFALWMFFVLDASQKCLILQKTNWWYCKFAYVQSVPDHESKFTSIGTFLYRLLSTLLTLQAYQKRLPPTHPMGCSPFIHVGSRWPDERNSGEVLSHRHPWGWGIAPEVAAVTKTVMVRMVFFFRNEICHDIQLAMISCFFKETNLQSVRSWRCCLFVKVTVQKENTAGHVQQHGHGSWWCHCL